MSDDQQKPQNLIDAFRQARARAAQAGTDAGHDAGQSEDSRGNTKSRATASNSMPGDQQSYKDKLWNAFDTAVNTFNFIGRAAQTAGYIWNNYAGPVASVLNPPLRYAGWQYMKIFNRASYTLDDMGERTEFSPKRCAAMIVGTVAAGAFAVNNWLFVPAAYDLAWDTYRYHNSEQMDIYLNTPERLETGVYEVSGCKSYPCSDKNTIYFHISDNVWKDAEYLFSHGHFHYPENIAGVMTGEANKCTLQVAGSQWKMGQRNFDWRMKILDAECTPVSVDQLKDEISLNSTDAGATAEFTSADPSAWQVGYGTGQARTVMDLKL